MADDTNDQAEAKPAPKPPAREANGKLTRYGMEQAIREGGSVLHQGRHILKAEDLPTEAELAGDDEAARRQAAANLQSQIALLQSQLGSLGAIADAQAASQPKAPGGSKGAK